MLTENITQINLKANEELVKRTKLNTNLPFYSLGKERYVNKADKHAKPDWHLEGIDFINQFYAMSKREQYIIKLMKDKFKWDSKLNSYNYEVELVPDSVDFDTSVPDTIPYESFLKGFNLLHKKDLMRRTRRYKYMLNPAFFFPSGDAHLHFTLLWNEAKPS